MRQILKDTKPVSPHIIARMRAPEWVSCCALCNEMPECFSWSHDADRPAGLINCLLMSSFASARHSQGQTLGHKKMPGPGEPQPLQQVWETYEVPAVASPISRLGLFDQTAVSALDK